MKRFKNYALWIAIAAVVGMALVDFGVIPDTDVFNTYVEKILYILILAGVINNPSSGSGFKDSDER